MIRYTLRGLTKNFKRTNFPVPVCLQSKFEIHTVRSSCLQQCYNLEKDNPFSLTETSYPSKVPQGSSDILEEKLHQAKSTESVLQLVSRHHTIMNNKHVADAFSCLFRTANEQPWHELFNPIQNSDFLNLCSRTLKLIRSFTNEEVLTIIKTLTYFNVPTKTNIMQGLCQILRHNINDLSLAQIVFLDFLLEKQQKTPLVEALLIALPLVFQSQLDIQMDPENIPEMVSCLRIATRKNIKESCIEKLKFALLEKADKLSSTDAYSIVMAFTSHQYRSPSMNEELLDVALDIVSQNIEKMKDKSIMPILITMERGYIYKESVILALIKKAIMDRWNLDKLHSLLAICQKQEYISLDLLNYAVEVIKSSRFEIESNQWISLIDIVSPFALIGYMGDKTGSIWKMISQCERKIESLKYNSKSLFLKLVSNLCLLGCYPLPSLFAEDFLLWLSNYVQRAKMNVLWELCVIEWATKIVYADYNGRLLPSQLLNDVINRIYKERQEKKISLEPFIKTALGGTQFYQTNIVTKYGHAIDYVLAMRKGNYPIAIGDPETAVESGVQSQKKIMYIEELEIPEESKIVTILLGDGSCYCRNSLHLKGWMKMQLNTLSKLGYLPVLINIETWTSLLDHEKIPYLMREIKEVINDDENKDKNMYPAM